MGDELDAAARHAPATTALAFGDRSWSFPAWNRASLGFAGEVARAVGSGERVAVLARNHPTVALALSAVPRAGRVLVLPNWRHHPAEVADSLVDVGVSLLVGTSELVNPVLAEFERRADPAPSSWPLPGIDELAAAAPLADDLGRPAQRVHDAAWIIHTSGTTGTPKGVVLTHASLLAGATTALFGRPVQSSDTYLYPFPLCHVSAHNVLAHHLARRPVVLAERFDPGLFWEQARRWGATTASLAPTMLAMLLDDPETASVPPGTLRAIGYGASAITPELLTESAQRLGCDLAGGYGMTEASGNAVFLDAATHRDALVGRRELLASAGFPGPLTRVRISPIPGGETGAAEVASGVVGQIELAGPQVAAGYWNRPDATATTFGTDGWLRTGDLGRLDADGRLWVTDRLKDLVITGGENVSAREVELVLAGHPAVKAVAVVGAPDDRWGEVVTAVVVPRDGHPLDPAAVRAHARTALAGFKVPKRVEVVDALPHSANGKVDKVALRAQLQPPPPPPPRSGD
ncbi:MAG: AMP-binding protein [Microthrixaceae bacterium]